MAKKELFIFDFDDTLVQTTANIYVINQKTNEKKILGKNEHYNYTLKKDEVFDISEFDKVINPKNNENLMDLLKNNQNKSVILTARDKSEAIKEYLSTLQINVPVNAVGVIKPKSNPNVINAKRKKKWIIMAIKLGNYTNIHFWDDNKLNILEIENLAFEMPNVTFVTHLVKF